jgi:hemolysin III
MLVSLRDGAGPAMLALVWSLAALGIALDVFSRRRIEILQLSIYLLMGWVAVQQYNNLRAALSPRV